MRDFTLLRVLLLKDFTVVQEHCSPLASVVSTTCNLRTNTCFVLGFVLSGSSEKQRNVKTKPQGQGWYCLLEKLKKKPQFYQKILKTEKLSWSTTFYAIFVKRIFQNHTTNFT